jgi:LmbE family N-acetylglucosaminyl deacetylase
LEIGSIIGLLSGALLLGAGAALLYLRQSKYAAHFGYHRTSDEQLPLDRLRHRAVAASIDDAGVQWPPELEGASTVLLEVTVEARGLGQVLDPSLELSHRGRRVSQTFERGARGLRYVNLSAIAAERPAAGERIAVEGRRLVVLGREARWIAFDQQLPSGTSLVVAPHPDDAEIAAFGLYSTRPSWVVTVTAGEVGSSDFGGLFTAGVEGAARRGQVRLQESLHAPAIGRVPPERAVNLGYFDGTLEAMFTRRGHVSSVAGVNDLRFFRRHNVSSWVPTTNGRATWRALVEDLRALIEQIEPRILAAPHPILEQHPDHRFAGLATLEALERSGPREGVLLLYAVHAPGAAAGAAAIHPLGPATAAVGLPRIGEGDLLGASILSHGLSESSRREKILALDTFCDLRPPPPGERSIGAVIAAALRDVYRRLVVYDSTFFRKAARPNEIFFALPFEEVPGYRRRVEERLRR